MEKAIDINRDDLFEYAKLSCKLPQLLEGAIVCKIIQSTAAQLGIEVNREDLQQAADSFRIEKKLHQADETKFWLQKHFLSLDDFETLIYINTLSEKLAKHLFADQVESYFEENKDNYVEVVMYEIVLNDHDLATELYYSLKMGKGNFHSLARRYIKDANLRRSGGYKGVFFCHQLPSDIAQAVLAVRAPQLLKPIVTAKGVHLVLIEEMIQPKLDERLQANIMSDLFSHWLEQQILQTQVETHFELTSQPSQSEILSYFSA
jgi:parvulin-like peptidyl-prolyl isomerase